MKNDFVKIFAAAFVMFVSVICAGCFQGKSDLTIDDDGRVTLHNELIGVPLMQEPIEGLKNDMERSQFVKEITPIARGNMSGYRITMQYETVQQFAAQEISLFRNGGGNIQQHKGWFFDAYNFNFAVDAPEEGEYLDNPFVQSLMPQISFELVINLPYAVEQTNAHNISNEGKTLTWNLTSAITSGKNISMQTQFRIWHKEKIALTIAIIILLLGGAIHFARKSKQCEAGSFEEAKNTKFMQICAALAAAAISATVFILISPVTFTPADIITPARLNP